ncbi:hypothetical protein OESDEN_19636 [Oesophagostomum dentatum]|uniref:Aldehyde oxidase/xanthine dehydrogenase first molybdopterin binding domain-containing protein n=1 Tax=Oesophagostomum dentatum TaxID=61180 RepID=A0A0B1SBW7_OESDE|nr:hypothetical protein OESDEN_19636 [Oesophagostomum dentatum]
MYLSSGATKELLSNKPLTSFFRGFGGPQGMFCAETVVKHVAEELGMDHDKLREINFYEEGGCTPFGMHLRQNNIARTWYECKESSDYERRKEQVLEYNRFEYAISHKQKFALGY